MTMVMILKNAFSFEMKLRSSSEEAGWVDFSDAGLKQEKIGRGHCRNQNHQKERTNKEIGRLSTSSTLSLGNFDEKRPADLRDQ